MQDTKKYYFLGNNNSWPKKLEKKRLSLYYKSPVPYAWVSSDCQLTFPITFLAFQTDRKEDKWFCMGDKLAHQKVLNKEWNNCTLGYMFRSHSWTLQVLATSHLEAWWWMALMYIRYRYSTTQLKWLSENRLTRFKAKNMALKMAAINETLSSTNLSFILFLIFIHILSYIINELQLDILKNVINFAWNNKIYSYTQYNKKLHSNIK